MKVHFPTYIIRIFQQKSGVLSATQPDTQCHISPRKGLKNSNYSGGWQMIPSLFLSPEG